MAGHSQPLKSGPKTETSRLIIDVALRSAAAQQAPEPEQRVNSFLFNGPFAPQWNNYPHGCEGNPTESGLEAHFI